MARHAKRRMSFSLVPRGLALSETTDHRKPGSAWEYGLLERGFAVSEEVQPDTVLLRRFLDAMRRQQVGEYREGPMPITAEAIRQTADCVLSGHLDEAQDSDLDAAILTLQGHLSVGSGTGNGASTTAPVPDPAQPSHRELRRGWTRGALWSAKWSAGREP